MELILEAERLGFTYPGHSAPLFHDISFGVIPGEILCILGPNGIGKSSLLRCLAGLATPTSGRLTLGGRDLHQLSRRAIARELALVQQMHESVFPFQVISVVEMGRTAYLSTFGVPSAEDREISMAALATLGIAHLADKPYTAISGGERQLVLIARVLAQRPRLLILDEPTAPLDFANQARFLGLMRRLAADGLAVIFTTHAPDHAYAVADRTLLMSRDHSFDLGPTRILLTAQKLSETYGIAIEIVNSAGRVACIARIE